MVTGRFRHGGTLSRAVAVLLGILFANFLVVVPTSLLQPDVRMETLRPVAKLSLTISALSLLALIVQLALLLRAVQPDKETRRQVITRACATAVPGMIWGVFKLTASPSAQPPAPTDGR